MPRPFEPAADSPQLADVYGTLLSERFPGVHEVLNLFSIGLDTREMLNRGYHRTIAFREPDVVVFHLGLNDCAPRVFRKGSRSILLRPWFRRLTRDLGMRFLRSYRARVTRLRRMVYVRPDEFGANIERAMAEIRQYNPSVRFAAVSITQPADWLAARSYGYSENVATYNPILRRVFGDGYVETNDMLPDGELRIADGYHLSRVAHGQLADRLEAVILAGR